MSSSEACHACQALCCVAPHYHAAIGFAADKPAHSACPHLRQSRFDCRIHADLSRRGFQGCVDYRCYGAGPEMSAEAAAEGLSWPALAADDPRRRRLFERFLELQALYAALAELERLASSAGLTAELQRQRQQLASLTPAQRADQALELALPVRLLCWEAELG